MLQNYLGVPLMSIAELSLTYNYHLPPSARTTVVNSSNAYEVLKPFYEECMELKEHAFAIFLNTANHVIGIYKISEGSTAMTLFDLKLVFSSALKALAQKVILSHNHPSGNLKPSSADLAVTRKAVEGAKLLDLQVVDHVILTKESYYSLADNGDML